MPAEGADVDFSTGPVQGDLDVRWIHGTPRGKDCTDPVFQAHRYDPHTFVLRQSKAASPEAPFLYLLFGNERAVLFDTGASKQTSDRPLRTTVDEIVAAWLDAHPREAYELVVAHTHGHHDHTAGDSQFADRPATVVVGPDLAAVQAFFGFTAWPDQVVRFDLGGRVLQIIGTPGHHKSAMTTYDPWSGLLLTGDNVLPGRILAFDPPAFLASIDRTVAFARARRVTHVVGCHIEMTRRPRQDYPIGSRYQPDEPPLWMTTQQLAAVRDAAHSVADRPGAHTFDDFLLMNGPPRHYVARLIARGLWAKIRPHPARPRR